MPRRTPNFPKFIQNKRKRKFFESHHPSFSLSLLPSLLFSGQPETVSIGSASPSSQFLPRQDGRSSYHVKDSDVGVPSCLLKIFFGFSHRFKLKRAMDIDEFRMILLKSKVDIWTLIETAIAVASMDFGEELRDRRDKIVQKLYTASSTTLVCKNCENDVVDREQNQQHRSKIMLTTPESDHDDDEQYEEVEGEEPDPYGGLFDDEYTKIFDLKERLQDLKQSEKSIVESLQTLADMDITYPVLHDTKLGKCVNRYRKHQSKAVKDLVKLLVSKWRKIVDEWVKNHQDGEASADPIDDEDSPQQNMQQKFQQNGHHQGSDIRYSPNPQNGGYCSERNYSEPEKKPKPVPQSEASSRPLQSASKSVSAPSPSRPKESTMDLDQKLNSARKRLHENYQEHENAKRQKKIQVMDIHEIPKPKNAFFSKNKGSFQGRHHR